MNKQPKRATLLRLWKTLRRDSGLMTLSLLMSLLHVAGTLMIPILTGRLIDLLTAGSGIDLNAVWQLTLRIGVCALVAAGGQWVLSQCNTRITCRTARSLREAAFRKLQRQPLSYLDSHPAGDLISRMISDVDQLTDGLLLGFSQLFTGMMMILGTLVLLFSVNTLIAVVVVLVTPLSLVVASFIASRTFSMHKAQTKTRGEVTAVINAYIGQQKTVRAFGTEALTQAQFDAANERFTKASLRAIFFSSLINPTTRFVNNVVYAAVAIAGALTSIATGDISIGTLTAALTYAGQYAKPFNEISGVISELQSAIVCAGRVFEWMDVPAEPADGPHTDAAPNGTVALHDISFRYVPERPLIEHFSLSVQSGQRVAIVGPTGCGKTTLINLLMRFYDIDGGLIEICGQDIRQWSRESLRNAFGMVLQETWLKSGTVLDNLRLGKPDATREEMIAAAKITRAHSFIKTLPNGYDTVLREDGGTLSGGQKQLLCITRVLLKKPAMLLLDEATSSLDSRTERYVQQAFETLMQGRTTFIVAHRLSTIENADVILVMNQGQVVEQGRHSELLKQGGFYAKLYNSQFAGPMEA